MEVALLVGVALAAGSSALLLGWDGVLPKHPTLVRVGHGALRAVRGLLRRLGRTAPVQWLLELRPFQSLAKELVETDAGRGLGMGLQEGCAAIVVLTLGASLAVGVLFASVASAIVAAVAAVAAMVARDSAARRRRSREVADEMPGIFRTLSVAMGSGQTLAQAVEYVGSHERGPAAAVFARMSLRLRCGVSTEEAVRRLCEELDAPGVELLGTALVISHRTGSPLRELLQRSARLVERQGEFERLLQVKTAQVRLSVQIVCLLPLIMICILALISPDFQAGLLTSTGIGCVALALALDGIALLIIRRLLRGVL